LSNNHETDNYLASVIKCLESEGYPNDSTSLYVRKKISTTVWDPTYRIRDNNGNLFPDLKVWKAGSPLNLNLFPYTTLAEAGLTVQDQLVGDTKGYQIEIGSERWDEIKRIAAIFDRKSYLLAPGAWPDAYQEPCIIIYACNKEVVPIAPFKFAAFFRYRNNSEELSFVCSLTERQEIEKLRGVTFKLCVVNKGLLKQE